MILSEKIERIINDYYSVHEIFYDKDINFVFEIELFKNLLIKFNFEQLKHNDIYIIDYKDFSVMENNDKINYLINSLENIELILLYEVNNFFTENSKDIINSKDIDLIMNILTRVRRNYKIKDIKMIKRILTGIFEIVISILRDKKIVSSALMNLNQSIQKLKDVEYFIKVDIENEINELTKKLKDLEKLEEKEKNYESERLEKDKLIKELEFKNKQFQEQLEKENELSKINKAIEELKVPCDELEKSQKKFRENRDNFDIYAMQMFKIATVIFVFMTFYLSLFSEINDVSKSVSIGYYLMHSFPILFPTIIGFLFIRQSNVNSNELDKINRRFILIHEVGQSLRALTEINDEKQMTEKTQKVIDKLIENILNYASENNSVMKNEESNILELNERIDKLIDTIDKKLTVIGKPN